MPTDLQALVTQYGLYAVLLGCILEGEAILLLASASAHLGLLDIREVVPSPPSAPSLVTTCSSCSADAGGSM